MCEYKKMLIAQKWKSKKCYPQTASAENPCNMRVSGIFKNFSPGGRQAYTSCAMMGAREYSRTLVPVHPDRTPVRETDVSCSRDVTSPATRTPYGKLLYIELNTDTQKNTAGIAVPTVSFVSVAEIAVSVSRFTFVAGEPAPLLFFFHPKKE